MDFLKEVLSPVVIIQVQFNNYLEKGRVGVGSFLLWRGTLYFPLRWQRLYLNEMLSLMSCIFLVSWVWGFFGFPYTFSIYCLLNDCVLLSLILCSASSVRGSFLQARYLKCLLMGSIFCHCSFECSSQFLLSLFLDNSVFCVYFLLTLSLYGFYLLSWFL